MNRPGLNILFGVLDWGLGHASRSIPIIRYLKLSNHNVIVAGNGQSLQFLKQHFPELATVDFDGPVVRYGKNRTYILKLFFKIPCYLWIFSKQYKEIQKIVSAKKIDLIISDNRIGLRSKLCTSIYITHQLNPVFGRPFRFMSSVAAMVHQKIIRKYDYCLIPDSDCEPSLSGSLSHMAKLKNVKYLGLLSRFEGCHTSYPRKDQILLLLSGPEPQRSIFEDILISMFQATDKEVVLVRGTFKNEQKKYPSKFRVFEVVTDFQLYQLIMESCIIICRSGYSSIMDMAACRRKAVVVATPGQSEQEFLAKLLEDKHGFISIRQNMLHLFDWQSVEEHLEWEISVESCYQGVLNDIINLIPERK